MRIGKTGLNPTMPICWYCREAKGEIILTGLNGELWAKNGRLDGQMPTQVLMKTIRLLNAVGFQKKKLLKEY